MKLLCPQRIPFRATKFSHFPPVLRVASFTFNPFQENTFVVDDGREAIIVDPGCWNTAEARELEVHLAENGLTPARLVLTHGHVDHVLGCAWVKGRFGLLPELHRDGLDLLRAAPEMARMFGLSFDPPPTPVAFLSEGDEVTINGGAMRVLHVPGHAPGHIALHSGKEGFVIAGDVLFHRSIGRTDLPGGDMATLEHSIRQKLYTLPDDTIVHCGHGPTTTIGEEKQENPFVSA